MAGRLADKISVKICILMVVSQKMAIKEGMYRISTIIRNSVHFTLS